MVLLFFFFFFEVKDPTSIREKVVKNEGQGITK